MRYVVARRLGRRGEGLGNEMLPWAKGMIASQVLGGTLIGPSWGLNKRKYYRNFETSRLDFLLEDALVRLPHYRFTENDYIESGEVDFGTAIERWASRQGLFRKRHFIVTVDGMYGGYAAIYNARPFLWAKLLNSHDVIRNVYRVASKLDRRKLFVAVHMRFGGDFTKLNEGENARGQFNIFIPGEWYLHACQALVHELGDSVQFHFFTDRGGPEFDEAVRRFNPGQVHQPGLTECSDLVLMAQADLRICSISSYSLAASFLSGGPYLWYEPQLTQIDGMYSLWGMEEQQRLKGSPTNLSTILAKEIEPGSLWESEFRGYAMETGGTFPAGLLAQLQRRLLAKNPMASLLEYGSLPSWTCEPNLKEEIGRPNRSA
jgi:hypothetical protein